MDAARPEQLNALPFEACANNTVAVKTVDDRGIESLKVMKLLSLEK